jgi:Transposase DDE domain
MNKAFPPLDKIKTFFPKHRICVIKTLLLFLDCVMTCRSVNLNKCKSKGSQRMGQKDGKIASLYTRFIRFFKIKDPDSFSLGITMLILSMVKSNGFVPLVIDRTNWEIGKKKINILALGFLLPNKVFIPIIWELLDKKGNSNEEERIALLERVKAVWSAESPSKFIMLGDREFIGMKWFNWMIENDLSFVIRLRWQDYFGKAAESCGLTVFKLEKKIRSQVLKKGYFQCSIHDKGKEYYFTVLRNTAKRRVITKSNPGDDFVVLLSPMKDVESVSAYYRKRWGIEVFFGHIKKNGFNLEDLNFKNPKKVQIMVGVVAIAYCLSIREGMKIEEGKIMKIKKHGARAISIFRNGYDSLQSFVHKLYDLANIVLKFIISPLAFSP